MVDSVDPRRTNFGSTSFPQFRRSTPSLPPLQYARGHPDASLDVGFSRRVRTFHHRDLTHLLLCSGHRSFEHPASFRSSLATAVAPVPPRRHQWIRSTQKRTLPNSWCYSGNRPKFPPWRRAHGFDEAPPPSSLRRLIPMTFDTGACSRCTLDLTGVCQHHRAMAPPTEDACFAVLRHHHHPHRTPHPQAASTSPEDHRSGAATPAGTVAAVLSLMVSTPRT